MYRLLICLPLCVLMSPSHPGTPLTVGKLPSRFQSVADDNAPLPDSIQMERLARDNPVEFLEACVKRYQRTVKGYTCTLQKQERINGRLLGSEVIDIAFRE